MHRSFSEQGTKNPDSTALQECKSLIVHNTDVISLLGQAGNLQTILNIFSVTCKATATFKLVCSGRGYVQMVFLQNCVKASVFTKRKV